MMKKRTKRILLAAILVVLTALTACLTFAGGSETQSPALSIKYCNLSMRDNVVVKYAVAAENITDRGNVILRVMQNEKVTALNPVGTQTIDGAEYIIFDYPLAAKEMTDDLYATAEYGNGENKVESATLKYSVLKYASDTLGRTGTPSANSGFRAMMKNLLSYGASAQNVFGYRTDRLADEEYYQIKVDGGTLEDGSTYALRMSGESFTLTAPEEKDGLSFYSWKDSSGIRIATTATATLEVGTENETYTAEYIDKTKDLEGMKYKYVVMIGVDGAGNFFGVDMPNISSIFSENSSKSYTYRTITPSISAEAWAAMLHGVTPDVHGLNNTIVAESAYPANSPYPSVFRLLYDQRPTATAESFCCWSPVNTGIIEDNIGVYKSNLSDANIVTTLEGRYKTVDNLPNLLFIHFNDPDHYGHANGYGATSETYVNALQTEDGYIGRVFDIYKNLGVLDDTLFLVTSDHGGIGRHHGGNTDEEMNVFLGIRGKDLQNTTITDGDARDIASILAYALGLEMPDTWTSRVPNGIFNDVTATERKVRPLPSDKDHQTVGTPEELSSLTAILDEDKIASYLPFDGNTNATIGTLNGTPGGLLSFEDGYFGKGIDLSEGYVTMDNLSLGNDSFSFSFWLNASAFSTGDPVIFCNKDWTEGTNQGIAFAIRPANNVLRLSIGDGTNKQDIDATLPSDLFDGWTHLAVSVNRSSNTVAIYANFRCIQIGTLGETVKSISFDGSTFRLGQDSTGTYSNSLDAVLDEFIFYKGALTFPKVVALSDYYRSQSMSYDSSEYPWAISDVHHKTVSTPTDTGKLTAILDESKIGSYLPFDGNTNAVFGQANGTSGGTVSFKKAYFGKGVDLSSGGYIDSTDLTVGKDSFSFSFWMKASAPASDPVILGNKAWSSKVTGGGGIGNGIILSITSTKFHLNIGNGSVRQDCRADLPADTFNGWTHFAVSVDRATNKIVLYANFRQVYSGTLDEALRNSDFTTPLRIGQDTTGSYSKLPAMLDEFIFYKGVISPKMIGKLADYYRSADGYHPADFLPSSLDKNSIGTYMTFDGNLKNSVDGLADGTPNGSLTYVDGYSEGKALDLSAGGYVSLPDLKLGSDSFSFSFWIKADWDNLSTTLGTDGDPVILANKNWKGVAKGFVLALRAERLVLNLGNGTARQDISMDSTYTTPLLPHPTVRYDGWIHVVVSVDRTNNKITVYENFKKVQEADLDTALQIDLNNMEFRIGQPSNTNTYTKLPASLDEFIFYKGVITEATVGEFADCYGITAN